MVNKAKLTFLGTGSPVPTARRNHPSLHLSFGSENFLFDCGEGTQRQFRKAKLNPCKLTKIFITHWHGDHTLGLPGLFQTLMLNDFKKTIEIFGPLGTNNKIKQILDVFMAWYFHEGMAFEIKVHEVSPGIVYQGDGFRIEAVDVEHNTKTLAYSFIVEEKKRLDKQKLKKLKLPNSPLLADLVKGKKIKIDGKIIDGKKLLYTEPSRKLTIITDTRVCANLTKIAKDSDLLVCESTYSINEADIAKEHFHLTSHDAATVAKKAKVKKLALVHLSQRYQMAPKKILSEAKTIFKNTFIPEDLDSIEI